MQKEFSELYIVSIIYSIDSKWAVNVNLLSVKVTTKS